MGYDETTMGWGVGWVGAGSKFSAMTRESKWDEGEGESEIENVPNTKILYVALSVSGMVERGSVHCVSEMYCNSPVHRTRFLFINYYMFYCCDTLALEVRLIKFPSGLPMLFVSKQ